MKPNKRIVKVVFEIIIAAISIWLGNTRWDI